MKSILTIIGSLALAFAPISISAQEDSVMSGKETANKRSVHMKINLANVLVDDQSKAERFYTEVLGFEKKEDIPLGEYRWLTVVSPDEPDGAELLLEPNNNEAAKTFQEAIYKQGLPAVMFMVDNVEETAKKLEGKGVKITMEPTDVGSAIIAIFDDTCGNLIQIAQKKN